MSKHLMIAGSAALLGFVACDQNADQNKTMVDQTRTTGLTLGADPNQATIARLTEARCAREYACNNVGKGKKWDDVGACQRELGQNIHSDFRQSECHVVLADKLQSCINEIQAEKCDDVFDLARATVCTKSNICKE